MEQSLTFEYVHDVLIAELQDITQFAEKHGLKIYLLGGSLLGSVREQHILSWDDDLDVGLSRREYNWLMANYKPLNERFELWTEDDPKNNVPYMRLVDKETIGKSAYLMQNHGISVDVFPIDDVEASERKLKLFFMKQKVMKILRNIANSTGRYPVDTKLKMIKETLRKGLPFLSAKKLAKQQLHMTDHMIKNNEQPTATGVLQGVYGMREMFRPDIWKEPTAIQFEGAHVWQVKDADEYLTQFFGDWRTPVKTENKHGQFYLRS